MTRTPIGMLIAKIHFHCPVSTSAPPMSGPKALAAPPMPIIAATAFVRLAESSGEKASDSSGVAVPKTNAPPAPWRARKAMRPASEPVTIQPMDAARKTTCPMRKIVRRPMMSERLAAASMRDAKVSE